MSRIRKPKNSHGRPKARYTGDRILIACEGAETEKQYFNGLRKEWKLHTATIKVVGVGKDPVRVVREAKKEKDKSRAVAFDQTWCVFDSDRHEKLEEALDLAEKYGYQVALSVPCFEVWFYLHLHYPTTPFGACKEVERLLNKQLQNKYKKTAPPMSLLLKHLNAARKHAKRLREDHHKIPTARPSADPCTDVDLLLAELCKTKPGLG